MSTLLNTMSNTMSNTMNNTNMNTRPSSIEEGVSLALRGYFLAIEEDTNFDLIPYVDEEGEFILYAEEAERRARLDVAHFLRIADLVCDLAYAAQKNDKHPTSHDNPMSWVHHLSYEEMGYHFYRARQGYPAFGAFIVNGRPKTPDHAIWLNIYAGAFTFPRIKPEMEGGMVYLPEVSRERDATGNIQYTYL